MLLTETGLIDTPSNFQIAENGLLEQTNGDVVFWSGRAATGLYYAYQLAKKRRPDIEQPEVIVPAMMCATAANTALITGVQPRFADVGADTGLMTLDSIKTRYTENTVAVVVIHLLGNTVDIDPIATWCKDNNLLLIEDPTHAVSGQFADGRYTGSIGDVAIFSFNRTKIIGVGNGVLLSNSPETTAELCDIMLQAKTFPKIDDNVRLQLALSYRNLHHALVGLLRLNEMPIKQISDSFMAVRSAFETLYLRPVNPSIDLNAAWKNLPDSLAHRLKLANIYAERLKNEASWKVLTGFQQSGVCWRFSMLINNSEKQVTFSEAVRKDGFHVSNLYWAANQFFYPEDICERADYFSRRIVNLWVDETVNEDYVKRCCDSLLKHQSILEN